MNPREPRADRAGPAVARIGVNPLGQQVLRQGGYCSVEAPPASASGLSGRVALAARVARDDAQADQREGVGLWLGDRCGH